MNKEFQYDVTLSFAGENRSYVQQVAQILKNKGIKVFYDEFEESNLWGKNLYTYLDDIYKNNARFCVMFLSKFYKEKLWTNHERESAQERAFKENREYILPVRFDNTEIPGIRSTVGYIDANKKSPDKLVELIIKKIKGDDNLSSINTIEEDLTSIPRLARKISDKEKKDFLLSAFSVLKEHFRKNLTLLEKKNPHVETTFKDVNPEKFYFEIYVNGEMKRTAKFWIGSGFISPNSISYVQNNRPIDLNDDNSMNGSASLKDDGIDIFFELTFEMFSPFPSNHKITIVELSQHYWKKLLENL